MDPKIGDIVRHPVCGLGHVIYVVDGRVAALWENAGERREVPVAECTLVRRT